MELDSVQLPLQIATNEIRRICAEIENGFLFSSVPFVDELAISPISDAEIHRRTRVLIEARKRRLRYFPMSFFGEPVWDMLLDLFVASLTHKPVSVSSLCIAANVPPSTALRYISILTEDGAVQRHADPHDGRRVYLMLSDVMLDNMRRYVTIECGANA